MIDKLKAFFTSQSNASATALIAILFLLAKISGFDITQFGKEATDYLVALGTAWAALKYFLKDAPTVAPGTVTIAPPVEVTPLTAAGQAAVAEAVAEGKAAKLS